MAAKPRRTRQRPAESAPRHRVAISPHPTLIAVELGSEWPSWMSEVVGEGPMRVLCQAEGEEGHAFAQRIATSVAESASLPAALLLCNQRADARQMRARRTLLTGLLERHAPRLWLSATHDARAELREGLQLLTAELPDAELRFGVLARSAQQKPSTLASVA